MPYRRFGGASSATDAEKGTAHPDILARMIVPARGQRLSSNMERRYLASEKDLPVSCPLPWTVRWNSHPRVYIPVRPGQDAVCPYCGALFSLVTEDSRE